MSPALSGRAYNLLSWLQRKLDARVAEDLTAFLGEAESHAPLEVRGLGRYLLATSLNEEWKFNPTQIWLHTDNWDHPAAIHVYERLGFRVYSVVDEPAGSL